jgi:hypothetical protein
VNLVNADIVLSVAGSSESAHVGGRKKIVGG